jgi:hypothetical protein
VAGSWLAWIAGRKQQIAQGRQQVFQECAAWCEQWQYPFPLWLLEALGRVPEVFVSGGAETEQQYAPGRLYQE